MTKDDLILIGGVLVADALWALSLWMRWPERVYEQRKDSPSTWMWLRIFRVPQTKENCVRFLQLCCVAGMTMVTVPSFFFLLASHH